MSPQLGGMGKVSAFCQAVHAEMARLGLVGYRPSASESVPRRIECRSVRRGVGPGGIDTTTQGLAAAGPPPSCRPLVPAL